jgi:hypothetical protein
MFHRRLDEQGHYHSFDNEPSVIHYNGSKEWHLHGKFHRLDGPAIELSNGSTMHYVDGQFCEYGNRFPKAVIMFLLNCNEEIADLIYSLVCNVTVKK